MSPAPAMIPTMVGDGAGVGAGVEVGVGAGVGLTGLAVRGVALPTPANTWKKTVSPRATSAIHNTVRLDIMLPSGWCEVARAR